MTFEEFKIINNKARKKGKNIKIERIENDYVYIDNKKLIFDEFINEVQNKNIFVCNPRVLKDCKNFKKEFIVGTFVYNENYGIEVNGIILERLDEENYLVQYKDFYGNYWTEESNINELA